MDIFEACKKGDLDFVEKGADVNMKTGGGMSPLNYASCFNYLEIVKCLVEKGADINMKDIYEWTPLHEASYHNNIEIVKYLLDCGAERNGIDDNFSVEVKEVLMTY